MCTITILEANIDGTALLAQGRDFPWIPMHRSLPKSIILLRLLRSHNPSIRSHHILQDFEIRV
jgi:hypothetical protein